MDTKTYYDLMGIGIIITVISGYLLISGWKNNSSLKFFVVALLSLCLVAIYKITNYMDLVFLWSVEFTICAFMFVVTYFEKRSLEAKIREAMEDPGPSIDLDDYLAEQEMENCKPENKPTSMLVD